MLNMIIAALVIVFFFMTFVFFLAQILEDNSIVDIVWGLGFAILAVYTYFAYGSAEPRQLLVTLLTVIWGLRLSIHIFSRKKGKGEDFRYKNWREEWGENFLIRSFLQIFMLQGLTMVIISLPVLLVNYIGAGGLTFWDNLGLTIWSFGFVFETVADYQLGKFITNPENKGKIMTEGLWKYSRHPNYFGETAMWWGIYIIALSSPYGIFTIVSPILITYLLVFVSGVPLLEKRYAENKKYQKYAKKTSKFIPRIPKENG